MKYTMMMNYSEITVDTALGQVTGDTYRAKESIKSTFAGITWNRDLRVWEMDGSEMEQIIQKQKLALERCYNLKPVSPEEAAPKANAQSYSRRPMNGLCPKCGTYCYGDCETN